MSRAPDRKPSTLAAQRALAASRPAPIPAARKPTDGRLSVQEIARELAKQPFGRGAGTGPTGGTPLAAAKGGKAASAPAAPATSPRAAGKRTTDADHRVVLTAIVCFVICVGALAAVKISDNMQANRARESIDSTFKEVHAQQQNFRVLNSRFATWPELEASGAQLPADQTVAGSNADASHWFLSLRDRKTGVVCDRTGELFDESYGERKQVCRDK